MRQYIQAILHSYSDVYFIRNTYIGLIILIASFLNYNVFLMGLLSLVSAILFGAFIGVDKESLKSGFLTYNALLVGSSVGYLFHISPLTIFFVISAGIFTLFVCIMLHNVFYYYLKLPIFSLPFVFVSSMTYMASFRYSNLFVSEFYHNKFVNIIDFPYWISGFFKSLGAVIFLPFPIIGLIFSLILLFHSRILFFLAVSGYFLGAATSAMMEGSIYQAHADLNNYNYILIAMAIGGVFLVPSPRSYAIAATAVVISTILVDAGAFLWSGFGILTFSPMPFNIVALCFLYVLNLSNFQFVAHNIRSTPEDTLDEYLSNTERFNQKDIKISLPFSGEWSVWQAFDGKWTHKGNWKYAYDFVIEKNGKTYRGSGEKLTDYFCFNKPVFSPVRGRVVKVVSDVEDNPIGVVNRENNWGNLVIIETPAGYFVEISHFSQNSIRVEKGDWVETGALLGMCGNSGFSPEPHIHLQVQLSKDIGAPTHPFLFSGYVADGVFHSEGLPEERTAVSAVRTDKSLNDRFSYILEASETYAVEKAGRRLPDVSLKVEGNAIGEMYFATENGKLYFAKDNYNFYFYRIEGRDPVLAAMFLACPRLPLHYRRGLRWHDTTPLSLALEGWRAWIYTSLRSFRHSAGRLDYTASWIDQDRLRGQVRGRVLAGDIGFDVLLHQRHGFAEIRVGELKIRRLATENS